MKCTQPTDEASPPHSAELPRDVATIYWRLTSQELAANAKHRCVHFQDVSPCTDSRAENETNYTYFAYLQL